MPHPWRITAVALDWPTTIELLCECAGKRILAPGVAVADDLAFWSPALRLVAAMVVRQHYQPDISEEGGRVLCAMTRGGVARRVAGDGGNRGCDA